MTELKNIVREELKKFEGKRCRVTITSNVVDETVLDLCYVGYDEGGYGECVIIATKDNDSIEFIADELINVSTDEEELQIDFDCAISIYIEEYTKEQLEKHLKWELEHIGKYIKKRRQFLREELEELEAGK